MSITNIGLILGLDRRIPDAVASLRAGKWERAEYGKAEGLYGKTIGIAGLGAIGREVAVRARAFGLHPLAWSRGLTAQRANELGVIAVASLDELAQKSDIFTVHLPLTDRTRQSINKRVLSQLPEGAIFVNAARADLVDYPALREIAAQKHLRLGFDVYPDEPKGKHEYTTSLFDRPTPDSPLVYGTPHIAASTDQAQLAIATETVRIIRSFLLEGNVPHVVNVSGATAARFQMVIRMDDKVGTFANVLNVIKRHGINVEEVTNTVFEGGVASCAKLRIVSRPSETCLSEIRAFDEVLHVDVVTLPNFA